MLVYGDRSQEIPPEECRDIREFRGESHSTHAVAHGNAFSRTRYCAHMEMYFLVRDIAHMENRP